MPKKQPLQHYLDTVKRPLAAFKQHIIARKEKYMPKKNQQTYNLWHILLCE
jgi:hypothetical protein